MSAAKCQAQSAQRLQVCSLHRTRCRGTHQRWLGCPQRLREADSQIEPEGGGVAGYGRGSGAVYDGLTGRKGSVDVLLPRRRKEEEEEEEEEEDDDDDEEEEEEEEEE
jgi:hypothetical protein